MRVYQTAWAMAILLMAQSQAKADDKSPIRLPAITQPAPLPQPVSGDVTIPADCWYVVESDVELLVFTSPGGSIKVTRETGPLKLLGKFVGEEAKGVQSKKYDAKHLVLITADKPGRDELLLVPVGAKSEAEAKRVFLRVGTMPQPPPIDPKPDVKPDVKPVVVNTFRVFVVYESSQTMTQAQTNVVYGGEVEAYLNAKCTGGKTGWRRRDKDANGDEDQAMAALWAAVKPAVTSTPCFAVEINGKVEIIPVEPTQAEMIAKLKTYRGE